jgi:transposase
MSRGIFVGLDINREGLQAAARPAGHQWAVNTDDSGISEMATALTSLQPEIVVLEAQGSIELPVAGTLATEGLPLAFVSPRNVREFARSIGYARGARNHAELLAHFGELVRPEVRPISPSLVEQLRGLKARQREVMHMLQLERSREDTDVLPVQRHIRNHIQFLEKSVVALNEEINQTVRSSSIWR